MKADYIHYSKNYLLPCLIFPMAAGAFTGVLIFLFKLCASLVISLSSALYAAVRTAPTLLPLLLAGAAVIGIIASLILKNIPESRGGGIPTSIALLRGIVTFRWVRGIISVFFSAMLTYLCGVPLGNEGPSVQIGTAVGSGVTGKHPAWRRYIMTSGASAGFAAATGAPLTGIMFAFEEAHRRFSPMLFLVSSIGALTGTAVMNGLCELSPVLFGAEVSPVLFRLTPASTLPMKYLWLAAVIGIATGGFAALYTKCYRPMRRLIRERLAKIPYSAKIALIFTAVAAIGFFSPRSIGSGHDLVDELLEGHGVNGALILVFIVRAALLLAATNADVTGGLFVPTLAFGAVSGSLMGYLLVTMGLLPEEYYGIAVVIGITAFLSASSRTPLMALTFALEALGGLSNLLPIAVGGTAAFLFIEAVGIPDFTDIVLEAKAEAVHAGRTAQTVERHITVSPDSFVVGKEIRDILWPASCVILSVKRADTFHAHGGTAIGAGDVLFVHYRTYAPEETLCELENLVGRQEGTNAEPTLAEDEGDMPEI
ncbi:MAG: hypothetical protein E7638_04140 [Ruminococcaceae bacterium]|nr:hypothetical protein [Oscillospiraceae bacterium]